MRLLLLHTDESIRAFMPDILSAWLATARPGENHCVESEDGAALQYFRLVALLNAGFDCIMVNLRLPAMLSVRAAELAHLARLPTRLILMSGSPEDLGPAVRLYDDYIRTPFYERSLPVSLQESLGKPFAFQDRPLVSQEHLDIAILNLLHRFDFLAPGSRGALHAFSLYRDAFLHRPLSAWNNSTPFPNASPAQRLEFFARVDPMGFSKRVAQVVQKLEQHPRLSPHQKNFLSAQFDLVLDAAGLVLMNFRNDMAQILEGLEEFGQALEGGAAWSDPPLAHIRELLVAHSRLMPYVHQGLKGIAGLIPPIE